MVIYSAQKNTLNSPERGAGFNAQPGSCLSPPPAARADTGEHFTAKGPHPLLPARGGSSSTFPVECGAGRHEGLILSSGSGCKRCCRSCGPSRSAFGANGAWEYHALSKEYGKNLAITPPGTRETETCCPVCPSHSAALADRQVRALLFFQHRNLCPARIWHSAWKGKLLVLSWKSITAGSIPDKPEKVCQEAVSTFKANFYRCPCSYSQLRVATPYAELRNTCTS